MVESLPRASKVLLIALALPLTLREFALPRLSYEKVIVSLAKGPSTEAS